MSQRAHNRNDHNSAAVFKTDSIWESYMVLTRLHWFPVGSIVAFWPCTWGFTMSAYTLGLAPRQLVVQSALYFLGSTLAHSAVCVWDDFCDRKLDSQVARTKHRPLVTGEVSVAGAMLLLIALIAACFTLLALAGRDAIKLGPIALLSALVYPTTKRWTSFPQLWMGIMTSCGLLISWVANTGTDPARLRLVFVLCIGSICWSVYYDAIYACQDRRDDMRAGIGSAAILFGARIRPILACFGAGFAASLAYAGVLNSQGPLYFLVSVAGTALYIARQLATLDFDNAAQCWAAFKGNGTFGAVIWAGMLGDYAHRVILQRVLNQ